VTSRFALRDGRDASAGRAPIALGSARASLRASAPPVSASYPVDDLFCFAESYARLVTNLGFSRHGHPIHVVMVTSAVPGDGKTTVAANLALTLAREGKRVLLIDADLRGGRLDSMLGIAPRAGLAEVCRGMVSAEEALAQVATAGDRELHVLVRGTNRSDPSPLLSSAALRDLIMWARERFDMVVVDTPPVNSVADAGLLSQHCDGVLLVARAGVTARDALVFAIEQLRLVSAPLIGAVLNDVDLRSEARVDGAYEYYGQYVRTPASSAVV
jgi:non-specific protein-tyrosine kinase